MNWLPPLVIFGVFGAVVIFLMWLSAALSKKRQEAIAKFAAELGLTYSPLLLADDQTAFGRFKFAARGRSQKAINAVVADSGDLRLVIFDYSYVVGSGKNSSTHKQTVVLATSPLLQLPDFQLSLERFFHRIAEFFGSNDIDFDDDPEFSKKFLLHGTSATAVREFFTPKRRRTMMNLGAVQLEGNGHSFIFLRDGKLLAAEQVTKIMEEVLEVYRAFLPEDI